MTLIQATSSTGRLPLPLMGKCRRLLLYTQMIIKKAPTIMTLMMFGTRMIFQSSFSPCPNPPMRTLRESVQRKRTWGPTKLALRDSEPKHFSLLSCFSPLSVCFCSSFLLLTHKAIEQWIFLVAFARTRELHGTTLTKGPFSSASLSSTTKRNLNIFVGKQFF